MVEPAQDSGPFEGDGIDLEVLFKVLWDGGLLIGIISLITAVTSVFTALSLPNIYTASALVAPAESSGNGISGLMRQYGGIASLAGVTIPGMEGGSRAQLGIQLMKSRAFIGDFVERRDILPELLAVEDWDPGTGALTFDVQLYDKSKNAWTRTVEPPKSPKPSAHEAYKAFIAILGITEDVSTGYVTVSIEHQSPVIAAQWVSWLVQDVNAAVKAQDVDEATKSIEYLRQQASNTSLADLQAMFFELIQSQTETVMLAEVRPEYVFKTIDPSVVPEEKSRPNRAWICILGTLFGFMLGIATVLIRHYAFSSSEN